MNSGYCGYSRSRRAAAAEAEGKLPASRAARALGVTAAAVQAVLVPCEWHHTSKRFNVTDYYDLESVTDAQLAAMRAHRAPVAEVETFRANVRWVTWAGTRNHPKAIRHEAEGIRVTKKGKFFTFHTEDGDVRKMIGSNGTEVEKIKEIQ